MADIAGSKHTWYVCFQIIWTTVQRPIRSQSSFKNQIGPGNNISTLITNNAYLCSPLGLRYPANTYKQPLSFGLSFLMSLKVMKSNHLQDLITLQCDYFMSRQHFHIGSSVDTIHKILG